jgi:acyl carrier protein
VTDAQMVAGLLDAMRVAFQQPGIEYAAEQHLRDFFGFDSVLFVNLILLLEERFGVGFGEAEIDSIHLVGDIFRLLRQKRPDAAAA